MSESDTENNINPIEQRAVTDEQELMEREQTGNLDYLASHGYGFSQLLNKERL